MGQMPYIQNQQTVHKLNQIAHDVAYSFLKQPHPPYLPSTKVIATPSETAHLEYKNSLITSKLPQLFKFRFHAEPLIETFCKEALWTRSLLIMSTGQHLAQPSSAFQEGSKLALAY
jgi:hypothetical protein